jgi:hypothetical protein
MPSPLDKRVDLFITSPLAKLFGIPKHSTQRYIHADVSPASADSLSPSPLSKKISLQK